MNGEKCSAKSKRSGVRCNRWPTAGRKVCHYHGGATPRPGPDHPNWKHGRRSKYLPAQLAAKYEAAENDPELTLFRQDLALLEVRLRELLANGESESLWKRNVEAVNAARTAFVGDDRGQMGAALRDLEELATRGVNDALRWADVYRTVELLGKTKEREFKRLAASEQMISSYDMLVILGHISQAAKDCFEQYPDDWRRFANIIRTYDTATDYRGH